MKELDEIWILHESGTCLFNYAIDEKMNPVLFGGFFTAINQFGQNYSKSSIDDITMGENFLVSHIVPEYHITIVGRSTHTKKRKEMKKMLLSVCEMFTSQYEPDEVINWQGNLDFFSSFKDLINFYFNKEEQLLENFKSIF